MFVKSNHEHGRRLKSTLLLPDPLSTLSKNLKPQQDAVGYCRIHLLWGLHLDFTMLLWFNYASPVQLMLHVSKRQLGAFHKSNVKLI